ncbi:unnamed protein product [Cylindrotheca closterium]|uniref:Uncharacterized protein n=1 Tax=Cylindrotheca closterium TaxID=2856 RepID=A0AAD2CTD1_9STRA|nr:unnamed protein product [Cylindrotheca closterium]
MRRRGRSPTSYRGTNTTTEDDVLDEDDQSELIEEIRLEAEAQMEQFQRYFTFIGFGAIAISLVDPFLCQEECEQQITSCWSHSIFSAVLHGAAVALARNQSNEQDFHWFLILFALVVIPMIFWVMDLFHEDIEHFHIGLLLSNMVTFVGCILLRWDDQSTFTSIDDLHDLKYAHKTL